MAENLYSTAAELKTRLRITGDSLNTQLETFLEVASRSVDHDCNRHFYQITEARYFDGRAETELLIDDLATFTSMTVDSEGDGTWDGETWTKDTDFRLVAPPDDWPYTRIWILPAATKTFLAVKNYIKITGVWGWPSVPPAIAQETLYRAGVLFRTMGSEIMAAERLGDMSYQRFSTENEWQRMLLRIGAYIRPAVA